LDTHVSGPLFFTKGVTTLMD